MKESDKALTLKDLSLIFSRLHAKHGDVPLEIEVYDQREGRPVSVMIGTSIGVRADISSTEGDLETIIISF
jgi:hypothetical protein